MLTELNYEVIKAAPELKGNIYATNAPEYSEKPYLVYYQSNAGYDKTLDGYTGSNSITYVYSIMAKRQEDTSRLTESIVGLLVSLPMNYIGKNKNVMVHDLVINNEHEIYEFELKLNRSIIDFTIYFTK